MRVSHVIKGMRPVTAELALLMTSEQIEATLRRVIREKLHPGWGLVPESTVDVVHVSTRIDLITMHALQSFGVLPCRA